MVGGGGRGSCNEAGRVTERRQRHVLQTTLVKLSPTNSLTEILAFSFSLSLKT